MYDKWSIIWVLWYLTTSSKVSIPKKKKSSLQWNQETIHHTKARAKLHTFFSPGRQVESCGRHPVWVQTFIYYLLLQSKDKENEDDYPVTGKNRWSSQTWLNCSLTAARPSYNPRQLLHQLLITSDSGLFVFVAFCHTHYQILPHFDTNLVKQ